MYATGRQPWKPMSKQPVQVVLLKFWFDVGKSIISKIECCLFLKEHPCTYKSLPLVDRCGHTFRNCVSHCTLWTAKIKQRFHTGVWKKYWKHRKTYGGALPVPTIATPWSKCAAWNMQWFSFTMKDRLGSRAAWLQTSNLWSLGIDWRLIFILPSSISI